MKSVPVSENLRRTHTTSKLHHKWHNRLDPPCESSVRDSEARFYRVRLNFNRGWFHMMHMRHDDKLPPMDVRH